MSKKFRTAQSINMPKNADFRDLEMLYRVFDALATPFSFVPAGAYLPPISGSGDVGKKKGTTPVVMEPLSSKQSAAFFLRGAFCKPATKRDRVLRICVSAGHFALCKRPKIKLSSYFHIILTTWIFSFPKGICNALYGVKNKCLD